MKKEALLHNISIHLKLDDKDTIHTLVHQSKLCKC